MDGINSSTLRNFNRALGEYARYNRQELGPLIESRATRMRYELYRQYRAIIPGKEKIDAEAAALNYAIKRRKGEDGKTVSIKQELAARKRSRGWLSLSWIYRDWKRRRDGQSANFMARARNRSVIGKALIRTSKGIRAPKVELMSFLQGAVEQNIRRSLVSKAMQAQIADMRRYIARKQQEQFTKLVQQFSVSR